MIVLAAMLAQPSDDHVWPWFQSGRLPTEATIPYAIGLTDADEVPPSGCLLRTDLCKLPATGDQGKWRSRIEKVACRKADVDAHEARCRFELVETLGRRTARSACNAGFGIAGTSHEPARWELNQISTDDRDYFDIKCKLKARN